MKTRDNSLPPHNWTTPARRVLALPLLLAVCSCESEPPPEESDQAEATVDVELRDSLVVELEVLVGLGSEEETRTRAGASIAGFQLSAPLRVSVLAELECPGQIREAPTIDFSDPYAIGTTTTFGRVTSPNDFRCLATITPQDPVIPPVTLSLTFGASALWQGEIGDVEVALEVTEE